ncbi:hypothetical protein RSJ42_11890 [Methanosarcina hadiensis]|uniref:hypothetical protein n=1 Tax=Methanosarcina hadiensis TaxID=3078083 RepID=UPI003977866C
MKQGLQEIIKEKDKSIERLENNLMKAGQREDDLKQMHNNYFPQIQTLINQKAIGSPKEATRKNRKKQELTRKKIRNSRKKVNPHRRRTAGSIKRRESTNRKNL